MDSDYQHELEMACTAVQLSSILTRRVQEATLSPENSISKADFSPVTVGDFAVQALLTAAIHGDPNCEDDTFLAEESADELRQNAPLLDKVWELIKEAKPSFSKPSFEDGPTSLATPTSSSETMEYIDFGGKNERSDGPRTWVFDPIDGTQTFLRGQQYTINCAFLRHGREEIGVIGCPNLKFDSSTVHEDDIDTAGFGLMIFAVRGKGTWVRPMQQSGVLLPATRIDRHGDTKTLDQLVWSDCSTYTSTITILQQQVAAKLNLSWPGVDLYSSILKYAALGLGRCSVCMRIFKFASWRSNMWDHAGGVLIFEEAGGKVTDLEGKRIDFSRGRKMADSGLNILQDVF
ncbi:uncharacterized protein LTR77_006497 [Saxophila tyrrhenica]|uniref:3'(2'),5'-bisphosphate nucleotidase n=1 Tax=Saxophila tyrrhenica TaxID=1690608 RepID=A0AAV9P8U5_9PEZI|nr:hypothetical protein LTR77_006497 [Saxophila tyrrhenica]